MLKKDPKEIEAERKRRYEMVRNIQLENTIKNQSKEDIEKYIKILKYHGYKVTK